MKRAATPKDLCTEVYRCVKWYTSVQTSWSILSLLPQKQELNIFSCGFLITFVQKTNYEIMRYWLALSLTSLLVLCCLSSCRKQVALPTELLHIDSTMNDDPQAALTKLQSLDSRYKDAPEAVRMKFALLKVKAADKSFLLQESDSTMRALVDYYDEYGTPNERMEAYYYLGCAYRDLHDSPKAVKNYRTAIDLADTADAHFDWKLYAIINEQLAALLERQFRYNEAIAVQKKVIGIERSKGLDCLRSMCILGSQFEEADSLTRTAHWYCEVLSLIKKQGVDETDLLYLGTLIGFFARNHYEEQAAQCFAAVTRFPVCEWPVNTCSAIGTYYEVVGKLDSALFYYTYADERYGSDIYRRKSSLRNLYDFHKRRGNEREAAKYAELYILYSDSVEMDQTLAQTLQEDKMYQYWKDEQEHLQFERDAYRNKMLAASAFAGLFAVLLCAIGIKRAYRKRLRKKEDENRGLQKEKAELQEEVSCSQAQLDAVMTEREQELHRQALIAVSLDEVVRTFADEVRSGGMVKDKVLWEKLFLTIDLHFPHFKESVATTYGRPELKYLQFLYLLKAGFNKATAAALLGGKRSTANNWCIKLKRMGNGVSVDEFLANG